MIKLIVSVNALIFSFWTLFSSSKVEKPVSDMPMCNIMQTAINPLTGTAVFPIIKSANTTTSIFETDDTKAYSMPLLTQTPKGEVLLSWTEKDDQGITAFCFSVSTDKGKTFSEKKVIYAGTGVGNSRLFRAKLLAKKDGSLVAVFSNRADAPPAQPQAQQGQGGRGGRGGGGGRSAELVYCVSKDGGTTWTSPQTVDTDATKGLMRGFFDAILMANDEVAVAYLKDVKGSTKHEERDLRLAITKNGVFQAEKLLDAVVCDCCNINLLVDGSGKLNVIYRDNNDDIRDMSKMVSNDNGETFSKPENVHNDGWKIAGCPHSGAISSANGKNALIAWYSGAETEVGIRLVTQEGKKLLVLDDPSVKNPFLATSHKMSAMLWEQGSDKSQLVFRKIESDKVSETLSIEGSSNATNATGLLIDNQLLIAHEVKQENKKNSLKIATTAL
jgi:BNR repeat-like domain